MVRLALPLCVLLPVLQAGVAAAQSPAPAGEPPAEDLGATRAVRIIDPLAPAPALGPLPDASAGNKDPKNNPAGIALDILPDSEVALGSRLGFKVTSEKPGYVVLVDIDAAGKLTQIYPNGQSLTTPAGQLPTDNQIRPGAPLVLPAKRADLNYEFVASPPAGVGMVVAILSQQPVQMVDLPDVPAAIAGKASAADYVRDNTRTLKIIPADSVDVVEDPKWSFSTRFYKIKP